MQKHTPGPWAIIDDVTDAAIGYRAIVAIDGENFGETICNPSPMGEANARLIAAAPELLAALQGLLKADADRNDCPGFASAGNWLRANEAARAAIAKVNA